MSKYIRFVVGQRNDNPWTLNGVITEANLKIHSFSEIEIKTIRAIFRWMNKNVPCPPFKFEKENWTKDAVSWFIIKSSKEIILKIKPLISILRKNGHMVRTIRKSRPGKIVYRDKFQVVAETPKCHL